MRDGNGSERPQQNKRLQRMLFCSEARKGVDFLPENKYTCVDSALSARLFPFPPCSPRAVLRGVEEAGFGCDGRKGEFFLRLLDINIPCGPVCLSRQPRLTALGLPALQHGPELGREHFSHPTKIFLSRSRMNPSPRRASGLVF